ASRIECRLRAARRVRASHARRSLGRPTMRSPVFVLLVGAALLGTRAAAQTVLGSFDGASSQNYMGQSVAWLGDLNGDGYDDFAVGASGANFGAVLHCGAVAIYSGKDQLLLDAIGGTENGESFGFAVAGVGDLNGDGVSEILVGDEDYTNLLYNGCG